MEHQPFENWILSGDVLTPTQSSELEGHLAVCSHCASIKEGISRVEVLFRSATFESPSPGFTSRFKLMAAQREEEARRLQSYFFLGWTLIVTVIVSLAYITSLVLTRSLAAVMTDVMNSTINAAFQLDSLIQLIMTWIQVIPLPIILAIAAGSASLVILLTSGWVLSVWKISTQGVKVNE